MVYDFKAVEAKVNQFWKENKTYSKLKSLRKGNRAFFYLDGPPYTTGQIHVGHAWGKALRDSLLRYKRMCGFDVHDQPGFDMHGLPIEVQVEKKFGIKNKQALVDSFGMDRFISECEKYALEQMHPMIEDFKTMAVWMDWDNPYMTIKKSYVEGAWWAIKKAHENGYLYKGKKPMTWCPRCATALAKHELEYETLAEDSIFVKFQVAGTTNEHLIIWTTTPWTLPFNLAVMVNPDSIYVKAKVGDEIFIIAKDLVAIFFSTLLGKPYEVLEEIKGADLEGLKYDCPFVDDAPIYSTAVFKNPKMFSVVLSKEYVDTKGGSGLVHMAPGCGPEDYEVGKKHGLPAFNEIDESGSFPISMGLFEGLVAKKSDKEFIDIYRQKGILLETSKVDHEYAHCWRCKSAVVFRTTDQWFLAVENLKTNMVELNKDVKWVPEWAGTRWFDSWLKDLQDWCISRQRFWGVPLPIWECGKCKKVTVLESSEELQKLTGKSLDNIHRPWVDEVELLCECGEKVKRIPDVLDVWLDSGAAPWATLPLDKREDSVADFILEGKDQIRGWFNSLLCLSMVSREKHPYKAVYMHGWINDAKGRKMSKSLKNFISPYEVFDKYGVDASRAYMIGAAKPGLDMNYNLEDLKVKFRNLDVLWNLTRFLISYASQNSFTKEVVSLDLDVEEKFAVSKLHSAIKQATLSYDNYRLNEVPGIVDEAFLELSRTYLQIVREKSSVGTDVQKKKVFYVLYNSLLNFSKLLAPVAPHMADAIYMKLNDQFGLDKESVHLCDWPGFDESLIDPDLESRFETIKDIIQVALSVRDKEKIGVRWPLAKLQVVLLNKDLKNLDELKEIIKVQVNVKEVSFEYQEETIDAEMADKFKNGYVVLDTVLSPELEVEGFMREVVRRIQSERKKFGLNKEDEIILALDSEVDLSKFKDLISKKVGAKELIFSKPSFESDKAVEFEVKGKKFALFMKRS
jgi:isoleucyl-tRNA synthetase